MTNTNKTIYLHFGTQKTGTSALQHFFTNNSSLMAERYDILYPNPAKHLFGSKDGNNHVKLAMALVGYWGISAEHQYPPEKLWGDVRELIKIASQSRILLSSEVFGVRRMSDHYKAICNYLHGCEIRIVIYLRRQDNFLTSVYNEQIKGTRSFGIEEFILEFHKDAEYNIILKNLSEAFGKENIIVRPYEKQQFYNGSIFDDFFYHIFGIELSEKFKKPTTDMNPRLAHDALEFKRLANSVGKNSDYLRHLLSIYCRQYPEEVSLLSPKQRYDIINKYSDCNEFIAREFLGREDGRMFYAPLPNPDDSWQAYSGLTLKKALEISNRLFKIDNPNQNEKQVDEKLISLIINAVAKSFL